MDAYFYNFILFNLFTALTTLCSVIVTKVKTKNLILLTKTAKSTNLLQFLSNVLKPIYHSNAVQSSCCKCTDISITKVNLNFVLYLLDYVFLVVCHAKHTKPRPTLITFRLSVGPSSYNSCLSIVI